MIKYKPGKAGVWYKPVMKGYLMGCCDCGLVHKINFRAVEILKHYKNGVKEYRPLPTKKYQIELKVWRAHKETNELRKSKAQKVVIPSQTPKRTPAKRRIARKA